MIAPLRNTHRRTFALLAILVPAVLAIGVAARHPTPTLLKRTTEGVVLRSGAEHFNVLVSRDRRASVHMLTPSPDPLLYWASAAPTSDVPDNAMLIGPADPNVAYDLPREAGFLVLYSGGHRRIVDFVRLEALP